MGVGEKSQRKKNDKKLKFETFLENLLEELKFLNKKIKVFKKFHLNLENKFWVISPGLSFSLSF